MTKRPRPLRLKQLEIGEWMRQPHVAATRGEVFAVAKLIASKLIGLREEQRKYSKWRWRFWLALKRLFAAPRVEADIRQEKAELPEIEEGADDSRPAQLAHDGRVEEVPQEDGSTVKTIEKRGPR